MLSTLDLQSNMKISSETIDRYSCSLRNKNLRNLFFASLELCIHVNWCIIFLHSVPEVEFSWGKLECSNEKNCRDGKYLYTRNLMENKLREGLI